MRHTRIHTPHPDAGTRLTLICSLPGSPILVRAGRHEQRGWWIEHHPSGAARRYLTGLLVPPTATVAEFLTHTPPPQDPRSGRHAEPVPRRRESPPSRPARPGQRRRPWPPAWPPIGRYDRAPVRSGAEELPATLFAASAARAPDHGYELAARLRPLHEVDGEVGGLYRALRALERRGLVCSRWRASPNGPARRIYHVSEAGAAALEAWVAQIRQAHTVLHVVQDRYHRLHQATRQPPQPSTRSSSPPASRPRP